MARINLLPWREELRQERKKEFITQLVMACLIAAIVAFVWIKLVDGAIASQMQRNNILNSEISLLAKQVDEIKDLKDRKKELLDRMKVIQGLEGKRSIIVHYFDEFARAVPDGVYVTSLRRIKDILYVDGVSESNNKVSTFMRQIDGSSWFSDPNLKSVVSASENGEQAVRFSMQLQTILPGESANVAEGGKK